MNPEETTPDQSAPLATLETQPPQTTPPFETNQDYFESTLSTGTKRQSKKYLVAFLVIFVLVVAITIYAYLNR